MVLVNCSVQICAHYKMTKGAFRSLIFLPFLLSAQLHRDKNFLKRSCLVSTASCQDWFCLTSVLDKYREGNYKKKQTNMEEV